MLEPDLRSYISKGYAKIGDITYDISLNMRKGKNSTTTQRELYHQGIKMYLILDILFRHVTFDEVTLQPTLWRITEEQVNALVQCLIKIGKLDTVPIAPSLFPTTRPWLITQGAPGPQGPRGNDGTDANIVVQLAPTEKQLKLVETLVSGVKTYTLSFIAYTKQLLTSVISGGTLFEVGDLRDYDITITSTKGSDNLVTLTCTDSTTNIALQGLLNLVTANGASQPYVIVLHKTNQASDQTFTFNSSDGTNTVTANCSIAFVYPFLYGNNDSTSINPYTALTKLIASKSAKAVAFNFDDDYAYFCYPASYGNLTTIKDQNGYDVTDAWQVTTVTVNSSGLDNDWSVSYKVYRTILKTSIHGTFTFNF